MPDNNYTKKELKQEDEANYFACAILMPLEIFDKEIQSRKHMVEEERIESLAKLFDVPVWAVVIRMQMYNALANNKSYLK